VWGHNPRLQACYISTLLQIEEALVQTTQRLLQQHSQLHNRILESLSGRVLGTKFCLLNDWALFPPPSFSRKAVLNQQATQGPSLKRIRGPRVPDERPSFLAFRRPLRPKVYYPAWPTTPVLILMWRQTFAKHWSHLHFPSQTFHLRTRRQMR
jgi:hypothetical protein